MIIRNNTLSLQELGKRSNQEDSIYPQLEGNGYVSSDLYILCDGMGGHDCGEVASQNTCRVMSEYVSSHPREDGFFGEEDFNAALAAAYDKLDSLDDPQSEKKMGTTLTFLKFHRGGAFIAHIGDSRIYHIRPSEKKILHVTRDHSLVNDLISLGELTPEEARTSKQKNIITRAVQPNQERRSKADCLNISDVKEGDFFYMCSDGMLEVSEDDEIRNVICMQDKTDVQKLEILRNVTQDNKDNHSAHLIHITSVEEDAQPVSRLQSSPSSKPLPAPARKPFPKWLCVLLGVVVVGAVVLFIRQGRSADQDSVPADSSAVTPSGHNDAPAGRDAVVTEDVSETPESPAKTETAAVIELTSISLSRTTLELEEGSSATLTVKYIPSNATDKSTTWKSTDASAVKVSPVGKVTALKAGSAAIIASCQGKDAYCNVTVKAKEVKLPKEGVKGGGKLPAASTGTITSHQSSAAETSGSTSSTTAPTGATSSTTAPTVSTSSTTAPTGSTSSTTGTHSGHEWVDLGLSVKWATCNVGASSPEGYGSYFAWGETSPKSSYTWANLKYCVDCSYDNIKFSKYDESSIDNKTTLDLSDDAAHVNWGGSWRMPTEAEFQELIDNCTWTWTTLNGKNGYKVKSKKNGNSVFLPAAGWRYDASLGNAGSDGFYWSSSLSEGSSFFARNLYFNSGYHYTSYYDRRYGQSVRPVFR